MSRPKLTSSPNSPNANKNALSKKELEHLYHKFGSYKALAKHLGYTYAWIHKVCNQLGIVKLPPKKFYFPSKTNIIKLYEQLLSFQKVADTIGCSYSALLVHCKIIKLSPVKERNKFRHKLWYLSKKELLRLYQEHKTIVALATHLQCSSFAVKHCLDKFNIPVAVKGFKFPSEKQLEKLYAQYGSLLILAKHLGCSYGSLRWHFDTKVNIETNLQDRRQYNVNDPLKPEKGYRQTELDFYRNVYLPWLEAEQVQDAKRLLLQEENKQVRKQAFDEALNLSEKEKELFNLLKIEDRYTEEYRFYMVELEIE